MRSFQVTAPLANWPAGLLFATFFLCFSISANAYTLLFDGGFESGVLQGWVPGKHGTAIVARRGSCFSDQDTRKLSIRGDYAGLLRSPDYLSIGNAASLTSKRFTAGNGLSFFALSENKTHSEIAFALNISILDQDGTLLETRPLVTAQSSLLSSCPSGGTDTRFSQHFVNTQAYQGKTIKLRFAQHPDTAAQGGFTLIDDVTVFLAGELSVNANIPLAAASAIFDLDTQNRYLSAALPGNIEQTRKWEYSWYIQGEDKVRAYYNPCINTLTPGNYSATLTVRNATALASDTLYFNVGEAANAEAPPPNTGVCNIAHPLDGAARAPASAT
jgi:hypothetical protein